MKKGRATVGDYTLAELSKRLKEIMPPPLETQVHDTLIELSPAKEIDEQIIGNITSAIRWILCDETANRGAACKKLTKDLWNAHAHQVIDLTKPQEIKAMDAILPRDAKLVTYRNEDMGGRRGRVGR